MLEWEIYKLFHDLRDGYVTIKGRICDGHVTVKSDMSVMTVTGFINLPS